MDMLVKDVLKDGTLEHSTGQLAYVLVFLVTCHMGGGGGVDGGSRCRMSIIRTW